MLSSADTDQLILVDKNNRALGQAEKIAAHRKGLLHRAFSIFLVDPHGRILLQKRHPAKYHSGGLWANTCCGHPRPGEPTSNGARRRLSEELGVRAVLTRAFRSAYQVRFENGLSENEIVEVYFGPLAGELRPHRDEVVDMTTMTLNELSHALEREPGAFAFWLHHYLRQHRPALEKAVAGVCRSELTTHQADL